MNGVGEKAFAMVVTPTRERRKKFGATKCPINRYLSPNEHEMGYTHYLLIGRIYLLIGMNIRHFEPRFRLQFLKNYYETFIYM